MASEKAGGSALQHVGDYTYDPRDSLGRGSFADVFKGKDKAGNTVAIKRIHQNRLKKESSRKLLRSEVSIMQISKHPNIVRLFEYIDTAEHVCLVMEHCNGGELSSYITNNHPLSEQMVVRLLRGIADALQCLHKKDILHRDLKPQNILIQFEPGTTIPTIKVADFGFARHLQQDLAETFCGSPLYMAPEVLNGKGYDAKADLWSVGAVLYQIMTKQPPFKADSIRKLKDKLSKPYKLKFPEMYSDELRAICEGLLQIDPARRTSFANFFEHPLFMSWPDVSGVPYGDAPPTPSPSASVEQPAERGSSVESGPVDDRSYILIDKAQVELGALVDDLDTPQPAEGGMARISSWSPTAPRRTKAKNGLSIVEQLRQITVQVEEVERPASAIMAVASALRRGIGQSPGSQVSDAELSFKERVELLLLYHMARQTFHSGLVRLRAGLAQLREFRSTKRREAVQRLRTKFDECLARIEELRCQLPPELASGDAAASERLQEHGIRPPEELIYIHAMYLCREAAEAETAHHDLGTSEVLYDRALVLFGHLRAEAQTTDDERVLDDFIALTKKRLSLVVSQAKATSAARHVPDAASRVRAESEYASTEQRGRSSSYTGRQLPTFEGAHGAHHEGRERASSLKSSRGRRTTPPDGRRMTPPDHHPLYADQRHSHHGLPSSQQGGHPRHGAQPQNVSPQPYAQQAHHLAGAHHMRAHQGGAASPAHTAGTPPSQIYYNSPPGAQRASPHPPYARASPPQIQPAGGSPLQYPSPSYFHDPYSHGPQFQQQPPPPQQQQQYPAQPQPQQQQYPAQPPPQPQPHPAQRRQPSPPQGYQASPPHVLGGGQPYPTAHMGSPHQSPRDTNPFRDPAYQQQQQQQGMPAGSYGYGSPPTGGIPTDNGSYGYSGSHAQSHSHSHSHHQAESGLGPAGGAGLVRTQSDTAADYQATAASHGHQPGQYGSPSGQPGLPSAGGAFQPMHASFTGQPHNPQQHQLPHQHQHQHQHQSMGTSLPFGGESYRSEVNDLAMSASVVREKTQNTEAEVERLKEQVKQLQLLVSSSPPTSLASAAGSNAASTAGTPARRHSLEDAGGAPTPTGPVKC